MKFKKISTFLLSALLCLNAVIPAFACSQTQDIQISETDFIVPQGSIRIYDNQFRGRRDLTKVIIPKSVERLSAGSFYNCLNLKSVNQ